MPTPLPFRRRHLRTSAAVSADLRFGTSAELRPLRCGELDPQLAVFDAMSPESRYRRYLTPVPVLPSQMRRALAAVDGVRHVAWLASIDGRPAGIGRYLDVGPGVAEIAFEVADPFQGLGLGGVLIDTVTTVAAYAGVSRLQASVLPSNGASQYLLSLVGLTLRPVAGLLEADGPFHLVDPARVDRPAVVALASGQGEPAA